MANSGQHRSWIFTTSRPAATAALAIAFALIIVATQPVKAQTYKVIHNFTGGLDGGGPLGGVTMDRAGNLYGTTAYSGYGSGYGTAYQLRRLGSNWVSNALYSFAGSPDGADPEARVIFGPDGALYGTTMAGGSGCNGQPGCGTVFKLRPSPTACKTALCPGTETVLYSFEDLPDGAFPGYGDLIFDQAGNIYGTTSTGGRSHDGTVFELTRSGSGWTESLLYSFAGDDGQTPLSDVILDNAGNLYGTTQGGGLYGVGTVFQLTYSTETGWTENVLYSFQNGSDGGFPQAGLIFDQSGNLYGATADGGSGGGGTVFKLARSGGGSWTYSLVYSFTGDDGCGPVGKLVLDAAGSLWGATDCDGAYHAGSVFKLTPSNGGWIYRSLYDFCAGGYPCSDGHFSHCTVVFDAAGNLYGTTSQGGQYNGGVVWEITP